MEPKKSGSWYIFDNAILSDIEISDCNDTIFGKCKETKNFQECMEICKENNQDCKLGYFIKTGTKNFCVPVLHHPFTITSPYYRLRDKSHYPELSNTETTVFVDESFYPYPPKDVSKIFYRDQIYLQNIETGLYLNMEKEEIVFKNEGLTVQFLSNVIKRNKILNYLIVNNNDTLMINIPKTALVVNYNGNENLIWKMRAYNIGTENDTIQIHSYEGVENKLQYSDKLYFTFQGNMLVYEDGKLIIKQKELSSCLNDGDNIFFKAVPQFPVYKLVGNTCKETGYNLMDINNLYRNKNCWKSKKKFPFFFLFFLLIFVLLIFRIVLQVYK